MGTITTTTTSRDTATIVAAIQAGLDDGLRVLLRVRTRASLLVVVEAPRPTSRPGEYMVKTRNPRSRQVRPIFLMPGREYSVAVELAPAA